MNVYIHGKLIHSNGDSEQFAHEKIKKPNLTLGGPNKKIRRRIVRSRIQTILPGIWQHSVSA